MSHLPIRTASRSLFPATAVVLAAGLLAGCSDDDPTAPPAAVWTEVALPGDTDNVTLLDIAIHGEVGYAVGTRPQGETLLPVVYRMEPDGSWVVDPAPDVPSPGVLLGVAVVDGAGVFVGATLTAASADGLVVDRRGAGATLTFGPQAPLYRVAAGDGAVKAVGAYLTGLALTSSGPGVWTEETLPLASNNEMGIYDLATDGATFYTCGFDDGGPPYSILLHHPPGGAWAPLPQPFASPDRELRALAAKSNGSLLLGGMVADYGVSPYRLEARLSSRSPAGDWAEIVLPEPLVLRRVNAILPTSSGATVLGCGADGEGGIAVQDGAGFVTEVTLDGEVTGLAEAGDGTIFAVGNRVTGTGIRAVLLRRPIT